MSAIPTCHPEKPHKARGLCGACYRRALLAGRVGDYPLNADTRPVSDPYVDPIAVEKACAGDRPAGLTREERAAAVERLTRMGRSAKQIAEILGFTRRTVNRYRARVRRGVSASTKAAA